MPRLFRAAHVFDGWRMHADAAVSITGDGRIAALHTADSAWPEAHDLTDLGAGVLAPGFVDLQVNGGGGELVGAETDADQLSRICAAHARLGATAILPTLITDTPEATARVVAAGVEAHARQVQGFSGLHLEGPHLDPARKGAHHADLIRPMQQDDLHLLCEAATTLPALMVTLSPGAVTNAQIATLAGAGVIVSLGHSGCSAQAALSAHAAGARCVTHLYNAMGGLQARAPGLVGAALTSPLRAGIIADGVHVAPECLEIALHLKPEDELFLVTDSMSVAGTDLTGFDLNGRRITRAGNRLTLEDGTLAGADVTMAEAVANLVANGWPLQRALAMATRIPADLIGASDRGRLCRDARADLVLLAPDNTLKAVWVKGCPLTG